MLTRQVGKSWDLGAARGRRHRRRARDRDQGERRQPAGPERQHRRAQHRGRPGQGPERRPADPLPGDRGPHLHPDQVRRRLEHGADLDGAQAAAASAAATPWPQLLAQNASAWAGLWRGRIDVAGDATLATDVNASEFYLWSSTRADQDWSISPAGLSSNGYDGHIFWDAETWMFPSLLAQHPDLADAMETYRQQRLPEAKQHATATGSHGRAVPVGERAERHRADPAAGLDQQRGALRAAHHRRHRARPVAVLRGERQPDVAEDAGLAGDRRRGAVLGLPGDARTERRL